MKNFLFMFGLILLLNVEPLFAGQHVQYIGVSGFVLAFGFGIILKLVTASAAAPGATLTAVTAYASDDSLTILNAPYGKIYLIKQWVKSRTAGNIRTRSPRMANDVQGIRLRHDPDTVVPITPKSFAEEMFANDVLTQELSGSATAADIEIVSSLFYYEGFQGLKSLLPEQVAMYQKAQSSLEITVAATGAGNYTGSAALNTGTFNLKGDTLYAVKGYAVSGNRCATVRLKGPDTGNYGLGGPGPIDGVGKLITQGWFEDLSKEYALPLVPVISFENLGNTFIDVAQDEDGNDPVITLNLVELHPEAKMLFSV